MGVFTDGEMGGVDMAAWMEEKKEDGDFFFFFFVFEDSREIDRNDDPRRGAGKP
jgi:hypothetical protein